MKKYFILAMVAVSCLACNEIYSGTDLPVSDEVALKAVTTHSVSRLGTLHSNVERAYLAAGFQIADTTTLPKSVKPYKVKAGVAGDRVSYVYGLPTNYESLSDSALNAHIADRLKSGKGLISATALYQNDTLTAVGAMYYGAYTQKGSLLYTAISDGFYRRLAPIDTTMLMWQGDITDMSTKVSTLYTDHKEYVEVINSLSGVSTFEYTIELSEVRREGGFDYMSGWYYPDEAEAETMKEVDFGVPYVNAFFELMRAEDAVK